VDQKGFFPWNRIDKNITPGRKAMFGSVTIPAMLPGFVQSVFLQQFPLNQIISESDDPSGICTVKFIEAIKYAHNQREKFTGIPDDDTILDNFSGYHLRITSRPRELSVILLFQDIQRPTVLHPLRRPKLLPCSRHFTRSANSTGLTLRHLQI